MEKLFQYPVVDLFRITICGQRIDQSWTSQYDHEADEYYWVRTDARNYYVKDHLGSIRQTLNESGVVQSAMGYYAFGGTLSIIRPGKTTIKVRYN